MNEPLGQASVKTPNQLRELKQLLDEGLLTQEEFAAQKAKLLDAGIATSISERQPDASPPSNSVDTNTDERKDIENKLSAMSGMGCFMIEPLIVNVILAFFLPFLWLPVIAFIVASIVANSKRSETRGALMAGSIEVARSSLASAKTWHGVAMVASIILWGTEFVGIVLLAKRVSSLNQLLSSA